MRSAHGWQHGLPGRRDNPSTRLLVRVRDRLRALGEKLTSWLLTSLFATMLLGGLAPAHADVQYVYDSAGRLVQVIAADGTSAQYVYDGAGNITEIKRFSVGQLAISAFAPSSGPPGTAVTIAGSGFSSTPGQNTVLCRASLFARLRLR